MKNKETILPFSSPLDALLAAAGASTTGLAAERGVTRGAVQAARRAGGRIQLHTLARYAESLGGRLELRFVPNSKDEGKGGEGDE